MKAFPYNPQFNSQHNGMDLRDYFAAKAMQKGTLMALQS